MSPLAESLEDRVTENRGFLRYPSNLGELSMLAHPPLAREQPRRRARTAIQMRLLQAESAGA